MQALTNFVRAFFVTFSTLNHLHKKEMKKNWFFILVVAVLAVSCGGEEKKEENKEKESQEEVSEDVPVESTGPLKERIDEYVFAQDTSMESYTKANSLPFAKVNKDVVEQEYQSFFLYDSDGVLRVIEEYNNTKENQQIKRFYFDQDQIVFASHIFIDYEDEKNYVEKKYYLENGEVKFFDQVNGFNNDAKAMPLEEVDISSQNAVDMMELKGDFAVTFGGFIQQPAATFLLVNANKKGFNSALIIDEKGADKFVEDLFDNQKKYMGKKIKVKWEPVVDPQSGLRQNVYRGGEWID